jgi:hypothetical protein
MLIAIGQREELRSGPPVQYVCKRSYEQNLSSTPRQDELLLGSVKNPDAVVEFVQEIRCNKLILTWG